MTATASTKKRSRRTKPNTTRRTRGKGRSGSRRESCSPGATDRRARRDDRPPASPPSVPAPSAERLPDEIAASIRQRAARAVDHLRVRAEGPLAIEADDLPADVAEAVEAHNRACYACQSHVGAIAARVEELSGMIFTAAPAGVEAKAAELLLAAYRAARERLDVLNRRAAILAGVVPAREATKTEAEAALAAALEKSRSRVRAAGHAPEQDPRFAVAPGAAQIKFEHLATQAAPVRQARARVQDAQAQLDAARQHRNNAPAAIRAAGEEVGRFFALLTGGPMNSASTVAHVGGERPAAGSPVAAAPPAR